ncbi:MAG TPA: metal-sensitive transcriptional regulator [Candidatus Woesebacteria bacterium]|nr:metal-sensitive transcriptional regulator [Candidatus Woesebacteria bacterium]
MEQLDKRIGRILGQLRGIQKMVKENRDNVEILQQVSAVKKAIDGLSKEIIFIYIEKSLEPEQAKELRKTIERAIDL